MRKATLSLLFGLCLFAIGNSAEERATRPIPAANVSRSAPNSSRSQTTEPQNNKQRSAVNTKERANVGASRSAVNNRETATVSRTNADAENTANRSRAATIQSRSAVSRVPAAATRQIQPMVGGTEFSGALRGRSAVNSAGIARSSRAMTDNNRTATARSAVAARSATSNTQIDTSTPYGKCRASYYSCMDEFCQNRDAQLKRCACSPRVDALKKFQKDVAAAQGKLKDFNETLVLVGASKEQATAALKASVGEEVFGHGDESANKQILDEILEATKASKPTKPKISEAVSIQMGQNDWEDDWGAEANNAQRLMGADLHSFTDDSCKKIVGADCTSADLSTAQGAYQMEIEKDCVAIEKNYNRVAENMVSKVNDSGAMLDDARLTADFEKNSDTPAECKEKLLEQMRLPAVCGANYELCLDTTGLYVNKNSGKPILTPNLVQLKKQISSPTGTQRWSEIHDNFKYVQLLNAKRPLAEDALKNCQRDANAVWGEFMNEMIGNIYVEQSRMIDNVRLDCTKLLNACLSTAKSELENLSEFALQSLVVDSFRTQQLVCTDIIESCQAVLGTGTGSEDLGQIYVSQEKELMYKKCLALGKECIYKDCTNMSGTPWADCAIGTPKRLRMIGAYTAGIGNQTQCAKGANFLPYRESECLYRVYECASDSDGNVDYDLVYKRIWGDWYNDCEMTDDPSKPIISRCDTTKGPIEINKPRILNVDQESVLSYFYRESPKPTQNVSSYNLSTIPWTAANKIPSGDMCCNRNDCYADRVKDAVMKQTKKYFNDQKSVFYFSNVSLGTDNPTTILSDCAIGSVEFNGDVIISTNPNQPRGQCSTIPLYQYFTELLRTKGLIGKADNYWGGGFNWFNLCLENGKTFTNAIVDRNAKVAIDSLNTIIELIRNYDVDNKECQILAEHIENNKSLATLAAELTSTPLANLQKVKEIIDFVGTISGNNFSPKQIKDSSTGAVRVDYKNCPNTQIIGDAFVKNINCFANTTNTTPTTSCFNGSSFKTGITFFKQWERPVYENGIVSICEKSSGFTPNSNASQSFLYWLANCPINLSADCDD
ncbi:MAG: hypothetical protein LBB23_04800 [Rickettsiales bacterium]|jgi:hypothetical protein|nr:hypothetical protein [Rickettsiales bacterium]